MKTAFHFEDKELTKRDETSMKGVLDLNKYLTLESPQFHLDKRFQVSFIKNVFTFVVHSKANRNFIPCHV